MRDVRREREVGYGKHAAADVEHRQIHFIRIVGENAHFCNFGGENVRVARGILRDDTDEQQKPVPALARRHAVRRDRSAQNALNDSLHFPNPRVTDRTLRMLRRRETMES